jgi:pimeloyl-ACP methyl ester carboxylesterase
MPLFRSTARPLLGFLAAFGPAAAAAAEERACSVLTALARPDLRILRAEQVPEGTLPAENPGRAALTGAARAGAAMPAHCVVEGAINPRTGAGGQSFAIGFELRLPANWNGRLLFQGGGGMDGVLNEAVGAIPVAGATAPPALNRGYAVVSTDSGHRGRDASDASFALDQQARLDYGYAAIGEVSREARAVLSARYGRGPDRAYYMGCSNGGRTAMMAAQRFPTAFDGIVAGNPGFRLSRAAVAQAWDVAVLNRAAPRDAEGKPILAAALSEGDLRLLADAVLQGCDAADGVADGSIDAMAACRFDPASLRCPGTKQENCLSAPQVEALEQVFTGARDGQGRALYAGWPWDAGIAAPGWRAWKLGTSRTAAPNARNATLTPASLGLYFMTPPAPSLDLLRVDFDRIAEQTAQTAAINDATATMLSGFAARGGRLLVYHGNSDPVFSADDLRAYWRELARDNGGPDSLAAWARLFMVPGMAHCGGGPALDDFDPLAAIEAWVEGGRAPDRLLAKGAAFPGRSRPLCPLPLEARYNGSGDTQSADNFACRPPER